VAVILENPASKRPLRSLCNLGMLTLSFSDDVPPSPEGRRKINEWLDDYGEVIARAFFSQGGYWIEWLGLGIFAFAATSREVRVWAVSNAEHDAIVETFSQVLQPIILQALGWQTLHASAVVGPAGVLAFCGKKGSGKSTLAFAMQRVGWPQLADDALVLRFDQDRVMNCPLPFTPRLRPASRTHFAYALGPSPSSPNPAEVPLTAVFLLQQSPDLTSPRISLMPQARAFSELLAHANCFDAEDPTQTRRLVDDYLELVARVPVFALEYQPDLQQLSQLTSAIVEAVTNLDTDGVSSSELQPAVLQP
jgi:hypothetical protein